MAVIAAFYDTRRWLKKRKQESSTSAPVSLDHISIVTSNRPSSIVSNQIPSANSDQISRGASNQRPRLEIFARKLLDSLCDLQIITGVAIVIAGLVQMPEISYYHEQFVINYWTLTLNSFWAARPRYIYKDDKTRDYTKSLRTLIRVVTILLSCVLSVAFQGLAY